MRNRTIPLVVLLLLLVAAACGGGDDEAATTTTTTTTTRPTTTTTTAPPPVSALTGLAAPDEAIRTRPVVAVKFDNVDGRATPQVGINQADVVYEIQVEGQITRLLALFQSTDAAPVGPVRSARGSEVALLEELNSPLFAWHGANDILRAEVRNSSVQPRSIDDVPGLYFRQPGRPAPYNSFVQGTAQLRDTAAEGSAGPTTPIFTFADDGQPPSADAVPATAVVIRFPVPFNKGGGEAPVTYRWDGTTKKWGREQAGRPHVDGDGNQVKVDNVIVRFVEAIDSGTIDKSGTRVPTAKIVGEGEAWVFTQGTVTTGRWIKPDDRTPTRYVDSTGADILLTPGTTWVSLPYGKGASYFE